MDPSPDAGSTPTSPRAPRAPLARRPALGPALATLAVAASVVGCDGKPEPRAGALVGRLSPDELAALRDEARAALRDELREEVRAELKSELRPSVLAELEREHGHLVKPQPPGPRPASSDTPAAAPDVIDAGPSASPTAPRSEAELWSEPGTHIWPIGGTPRLTELYVGTGLDEKLPTDIRPRYETVPEILYCYTVFENPTDESTVTHVWRRGNRLVSRVELEVGKSPKWRTWSKQRTQPHWTGLWSCEVLGPDGSQLGLTVFQVGG